MSNFVSLIFYLNVESDKSRILLDNKGRAGIYMWTHIESGRIYIGSAIDLSKRLISYYSPAYLKLTDNYISRALTLHTHSAFSLSILEYIDITNLSVEESRVLILEREQVYLDLVFSEDEPNTYNLLQSAGSSLGFKHTDGAKALIGTAQSGKTYSEETIAKMIEAQRNVDRSGEDNPMFGRTGEDHPMFGRTGENHPMFGKTHSADTISKMRESQKSVDRLGEKNPMFGTTGENRGMFGKTHSADTIVKMREVQKSVDRSGVNNPASKKVFVYILDSNSKALILDKSFNSCVDAAKYLDCSTRTISNYLDKHKLYKKQWMLYSSEK